MSAATRCHTPELRLSRIVAFKLLSSKRNEVKMRSWCLVSRHSSHTISRQSSDHDVGKVSSNVWNERACSILRASLDPFCFRFDHVYHCFPIDDDDA